MTKSRHILHKCQGPESQGKTEDCIRLKDSKEMWHLNEIYSFDLDPFAIKDITGTTDET